MTILKAFAAALGLLAAAIIPASAQAPSPAANGDGRRVALVIGNETYGALGPLTNPVRDAKAISQSLRSAGFSTVVEATDLNIDAFQRTLREYRRVADGASIALVYFAGHGMEVYGKNWLIPLAANIAKPEDLPLETIPLDMVLTAMGGATTKVLILDACRNNPFERAIRLGAGAPVRSNNQGAGLAPINQAALPNGMLVMYATEPGATASDGLPTDANSPFARALIAELPTRGVDVRLVAGGVTERTMELTGQVQRPFVTALLGRAPVYIAGDNTAAAPTPVTPPPVVSRPVAQTGADAQRMLVRARAAGAAGDCQALLDLVALVPDGDVATQAQTAAQQCRATYLDRLTVPNRAKATDAELRQLAAQFNVELAALLAVAEVESGPLGGFDANGRPIILFEPHIFSLRTKRRYDASHPTISYRHWGTQRYPRGQNERWAQLRAAYELDPEEAISSTSWGRFQMLGQFYAAAGYGSATEFVAAISNTEIAQYQSLLALAVSRNLLDEIQRLDFTGFARGYNGPGYVQHQYDAKMRAAYIRNGGDASKLPAAPAPLEPYVDTHTTPMPALRPAPETIPTQPLFRAITVADLAAVAGNHDPMPAEAFARALNAHLPKYGVTTPLRVAHFLAQAAQESGFRRLDNGGGESLQARADLGNTQPGDGARYRKRGIFDIVGRNAYRDYGRALGIDLEGNPDLLATPDVAVQAALLLWTRGYHGSVSPIDASDRDDITAVSFAAVNHDFSHQHRFARLQAAKRQFGLPHEAVVIPNLGEPAPLSPSSLAWLALVLVALGGVGMLRRRA
ncbi:MAG: DUF3380 domain-containing protein [Hyphomonadaceae bacterium]|nr:DUF3380 domain-containing protein [Hyphomonadaceae bacterium]